MIGNHHDAWVYGGSDPNSGTAVLLEVARAVASVVARGGEKNLYTYTYIFVCVCMSVYVCGVCASMCEYV